MTNELSYDRTIRTIWREGYGWLRRIFSNGYLIIHILTHSARSKKKSKKQMHAKNSSFEIPCGLWNAQFPSQSVINVSFTSIWKGNFSLRKSLRSNLWIPQAASSMVLGMRPTNPPVNSSIFNAHTKDSDALNTPANEMQTKQSVCAIKKENNWKWRAH